MSASRKGRAGLWLNRWMPTQRPRLGRGSARAVALASAARHRGRRRALLVTDPRVRLVADGADRRLSGAVQQAFAAGAVLAGLARGAREVHSAGAAETRVVRRLHGAAVMDPFDALVAGGGST